MKDHYNFVYLITNKTIFILSTKTIEVITNFEFLLQMKKKLIN